MPDLATDLPGVGQPGKPPGQCPQGIRSAAGGGQGFSNAPNCPQMIAAFYGVLKAGAIVVQVNPLFSSRELENRLYDCGAETIILLDEYLPRLQAIQKRSPVNNVITVNLTGETKAPAGGCP